MSHQTFLLSILKDHRAEVLQNSMKGQYHILRDIKSHQVVIAKEMDTQEIIRIELMLTSFGVVGALSMLKISDGLLGMQQNSV